MKKTSLKPLSRSICKQKDKLRKKNLPEYGWDAYDRGMFRDKFSESEWSRQILRDATTELDNALADVRRLNEEKVRLENQNQLLQKQKKQILVFGRKD